MSNADGADTLISCTLLPIYRIYHSLVPITLPRGVEHIHFKQVGSIRYRVQVTVSSNERKWSADLYRVPCIVVADKSVILCSSTLARVRPPTSLPASIFKVHTLGPWMRSRISPNSPAMSSSGSSLLEEPTQGRQQFSNGCAIPPRVQ
jgi:hypothetical protein